MTNLGALPIDGLRPIVHYLGIDDLTNLLCTFDRRIMKALSFPGVIPHLHLQQHHSRITHRLVQYTLSQVRNVTHLSLKNAGWTPQSLDRLLTLNPLRLDIDDRGLYNSAKQLLESAAKDPTNTELRSQSSFLSPNGLPDFARLTTRLESLTLSLADQIICDNILLPPTITSIGGDMKFSLSCLPSGLRSLSLNNTDDSLNEALVHFTRLEKLSLTVPSYSLEEPIVFPETLPHVQFHRSAYCADLVSCFPQSITRLDWNSPGEPPRTWPIGLRVLNLLNFNSGSYTRGLSLLDTLECLSIRSSISVSADEQVSDPTVLYLSLLPSSLKSISIVCYRFHPLSEASSITPRMSALTSLIAQFLPIGDLPLFQKHAPLCQLHLAVLYPLHESDLSRNFNDRGARPSETFDDLVRPLTATSAPYEHTLELTMRCKCIQRLYDGSTRPFVRTAFIHRMLWIDLGSMIEHDNVLHTCSKIESISLQSLEHFNDFTFSPRSLTRLDISLHASTVYLDALPPTLTSLSSRAAVDVSNSGRSTHQSGWPFTRLTHLDTPYWSFKAKQLGDLHALEVFNAKIVDLADYNVIDLLTNAVTPKTRRNMKICIEYYVTGAVVPDDDIDGLKDITWSSLRASTIETLERALAAPMPSTSLEGTLIGDSGHVAHDGIVDDNIGRVVTSLNISNVLSYVFIPSSATRVNIASQGNLNLYPNREHIQVQSNGLRPEIWGLHQSSMPSLFDSGDSSMLTEPPLFTRGDILTRMTLLNVLTRHLWMNQLPSSLRYLHVSCRSSSDQELNVTYPKQLEVLILDVSNTKKRPIISVSGFPPTLRKMAILLNNWRSEGPLPDEFVLPQLTTVLFGTVVGEDLLSVCPTLSKSPLERFEICRSDIPITTLQSYGITVVSSVDLKELTDEDCDTPQPGPSRPKLVFSPAPTRSRTRAVMMPRK